MIATLNAYWARGLCVALAVVYAFAGAVAWNRLSVAAFLGAGTVVIAVTIASRLRWVAAALIVIGPLPFAVLAWWSIVAPTAYLLIVAIGLPAALTRRN